MTEPMVFDLVRSADPSGVSGTGVPATGVAFPDGHVALRWDTPDLPSSTQLYESVEDMLKVHGHSGATTIRWHGFESPERTGLQVVADLIAGGLGYTGINLHFGRQAEVQCSPQEWLAWLDALNGSADASVFVDRGSDRWPQQREWTTPDGQVKVLHLVPAEAS